MHINKSTAKVLQFFVGRITESFTLREVARILKMHVSLAHRAIQPLIGSKIIKQDKHKKISHYDINTLKRFSSMALPVMILIIVSGIFDHTAATAEKLGVLFSID